MSKKPMSYWIKERHNPQLGLYYVKCGQLSKTSARKYEKPGYGLNFMLEYKTEAEYNAAIEELQSNGLSVQ